MFVLRRIGLTRLSGNLDFNWGSGVSKLFRLVSRALLACLLVVVWFAPPAVAETVCEATDDGWVL